MATFDDYFLSASTIASDLEMIWDVVEKGHLYSTHIPTFIASLVKSAVPCSAYGSSEWIIPNQRQSKYFISFTRPVIWKLSLGTVLKNVGYSLLSLKQAQVEKWLTFKEKNTVQYNKYIFF